MRIDIIKILVVALFTSGLMSCASSVIKNGNFESLTNSNSNKGVIFVYRDKALAGSINQYDVLIDGKLAGSLPNGSFFTVDTEHGEKYIKADTGIFGKGSRITVEKSKSYCMKLTLNFCMSCKSADIKPVDKKQCVSEIKSLEKVHLK